MHLKNEICLRFLSLDEGITVYTSLRYRDDKKRRALGLLTKNGYFKKVHRFTYQRTNKTSRK